METINISQNKMKLMTVAVSLLFCFGIVSSIAFSKEVNVDQASVGLIIGGLVTVIVAGALLPLIVNQTAELSANEEITGTNMESLIGLWPLLIVVGVMLAIIGIAL
jgi:hypothetical protein